jgi:NAD(P)-dependent dehydrogenase (short-subunit alcohol dehydrogenase family)
MKTSVVVVIGGCGVIGAAICERLSYENKPFVIADLYLNDESDARKCYHVDVRSEDSISRFLNECLSVYDINTVIYAAGVTGEIKDIEDSSIEEFDLVYQVNVRGFFLVVKNAIQQIKNVAAYNVDGLHFVAISSVAATRGLALMSGYAASKYALNGLVKSLARELAGQGIRVNSISPGMVESTMAYKIHDELSNREYARKKGINSYSDAASGIPLKRAATPTDIAGPVCALLSSDFGYCTGIDILVDGGTSTK